MSLSQMEKGPRGSLSLDFVFAYRRSMNERRVDEYWMPKPKPLPLDQQAVYEAVYSATSQALKTQTEQTLPVITGETVTIWKEIHALKKFASGIYWWNVISGLALLAIAVKLWIPS